MCVHLSEDSIFLFWSGEHRISTDDRQAEALFDIMESLADKLRCPECNIVYPTSEDLKTHERSHRDGPPTRTCSLCRVDFDTQEILKTHMNLKHGSNFKHFCYECGRAFKSYPSFNSHDRLFHRTDTKCPVCDICGKIFPFESSLKLHFKKHSEVRPFICNVCGKSYKHKANLTGHSCM